MPPAGSSTRTTRAQYFEVGLELLAEGGAPSVTIDALCTRLAVTKGSFYHHFQGIRDYMAQLLLHWEDQHGHRLAREALAAQGAVALIPQLKLAVAYAVHHEAEAAIRALSRSDPFAAEVQRRVDKGREDVLVDLYIAAGMIEGDAHTSAAIGMAILIGTQQQQRPVDRDRLHTLLAEYQSWIEEKLT